MLRRNRAWERLSAKEKQEFEQDLPLPLALLGPLALAIFALPALINFWIPLGDWTILLQLAFMTVFMLSLIMKYDQNRKKRTGKSYGEETTETAVNEYAQTKTGLPLSLRALLFTIATLFLLIGITLWIALLNAQTAVSPAAIFAGLFCTIIPLIMGFAAIATNANYAWLAEQKSGTIESKEKARQQYRQAQALFALWLLIILAAAWLLQEQTIPFITSGIQNTRLTN